MEIVWTTATPRDAAGALVTVRMAGGGRHTPFRRGADEYRAGLTGRPRFSARLEVGDDGWTGATLPTTGRIAFKPAQASLLAELAGLYWREAGLLVETGPEGGAYATLLTATVKEATAGLDGLSIEIADLSVAIDKPLAIGRFAGTGGAEGEADAEGRVRRRSWGRVFNVEGRVFDKTLNLFEFGDPAHSIHAFGDVRDMGRAADPPCATLAWQGTVEATIEALGDAVCVQGSGVVAPSICMVKWWTQPAGPLTADLQGEVGAFYVETAPEIAERISAAIGGPAIANAAAMAALRPEPVGIHIGDASETAAAALDRLFLGGSVLWTLQPSGEIELCALSFDDPVEVIISSSVSRKKVFPPVKSRRIGFAVAQRRHSDGEISAILLASDVAYPDGTPVSELQPSEPNATNSADPGSAFGPGGRTVGDVLFDIGDLGSAAADTAAAGRQLERDAAALAAGLLRAVTEAHTNRQRLRDAGMFIDQATGQVRIYAVDHQAELLTNVEVQLSAAIAQISLRATTSYVDEQLALAVLDPSQIADLDGLQIRMGAAEVSISGLTASVLTKAEAATVSALSGTLTTVSDTLDALTATVTTKVDSSTFDAAEARITSVESTLDGMGDVVGIRQTIRQARYVADSAAESVLRALLAGDAASRMHLRELAQIQNELTTKIVQDVLVEAQARLTLAAQVGGHGASITSLLQALATPEGALATVLFITDVAGRLSGTKNTNDGSIGMFDVLCDVFRLIDPDLGEVFKIEDGVMTGSAVWPFASLLGVPRIDPAQRSITIDTDNAGAALEGQLARTLVFKRYRGDVDMSASAAWSIVDPYGLSGGTVTVGDGAATIPTGVTFAAQSGFKVRSVLDGITIDANVTITRRPQGAPGGSGGGTSDSQDGIYKVVGVDAFEAVSDLLAFQTGSGGAIALNASITASSADAAPDGPFDYELVWRWREAGGSFDDAGDAEAGSVVVAYDELLNGGIYYAIEDFTVVQREVDGLDPTTAHEAQLFGRRTSSSPARGIIFTGSVSAAGS